MAQTTIDLSDGKSMIACILGRGYSLPKDITQHPQVAIYNGLEKFDTGALPPLPPKDTLKALVYTDGLALDRTQALQNEAKRRGILYVSRNTDGSLVDLVRNWIATSPRAGHLPGRANGNGHHIEPDAPPPPHEPNEYTPEKEKRQIAAHGVVAALIRDYANLKEATAAEARRLFDIARQKGIPTTVASLEQGIRQAKRKAGVGDLPASLLPATERERLTALKTLDDSIAGLQLLRDWVERTEAENIELKSKLASIESVFGKK